MLHRPMILVIAVSLAGCKTGSTADVKQATYEMISELTPPPCTKGESAPYQLHAVASAPGISSMSGWPKFRDGMVGFVVPDGNKTVQFNLCIDDNNAITLASVQTNGLSGGKVQVVPEADAKVKGLVDVIVNQDYSALDIVIPYHTTRFDSSGPLGKSTPSTARLVIKGAATRGVAVVAEFDDVEIGSSNTKAVRVTSNAAVGTIVPGDTSGASACKNGGIEAPFNFARGTATFSGILCQYVGTAGTNLYSYAKMEITDTNAFLPAEIKGKPQTLEGEAIDSAVLQVIPHHNVCEATQVKMPNATYIWRMFSGNGGFTGECKKDAQIPDAPTGSASDFADPIAWKVKYGTKPWQKGVGGGHPFGDQGGSAL